MYLLHFAGPIFLEESDTLVLNIIGAGFKRADGKLLPKHLKGSSLLTHTTQFKKTNPLSNTKATPLLRTVCGRDRSGYLLTWPGYTKGTKFPGLLSLRHPRLIVDIPVSYHPTAPGFAPLFPLPTPEKYVAQAQKTMAIVAAINSWTSSLSDNAHTYMADYARWMDHLSTYTSSH